MRHSARTDFRSALRGRKRFTRITAPAFMLLLSFTSMAPGADGNREKTQRELDAACEQAREARLAPLRQEKIEACVKSGEHKSREACETEYSHFGQRAGNRPAMFYDIPECIKAFEFQNSYRQAD